MLTRTLQAVSEEDIITYLAISGVVVEGDGAVGESVYQCMLIVWTGIVDEVMRRKVGYQRLKFGVWRLNIGTDASANTAIFFHKDIDECLRNGVYGDIRLEVMKVDDT